jgi:hypothetical protein
MRSEIARHEMAAPAGTLAARGWLTARAVSAQTLPRWHARVLLDVVDKSAREDFDVRHDTRFRVDISSDEWGFLFCHSGRTSSIRVTEVAAVHGRDDFRLLDATPALKELGMLLRSVEQQHGVRFRRRNALVQTNLPSAEASIRRWIETL